MTGHPRKPGFAARPRDPGAWVRAQEAPHVQRPAGEGFTARLTIDVTPALRGRIKIAAFQRGLTVADVIRALLEREFPTDGGVVS